MGDVHDSYLGFAEEADYATGVAVSRYYELLSESLTGTYDRIESAAARAGTRILRSDRWAPNPKGAAGSVSIEAIDKGLGLLLKHAFGAVASAANGDGTNTDHTFTPGDLRGLSLTAQVGRVASDGTLYPFTYEGGKVASWELTNQVDGVLQFNADFDFAKETAGDDAGGIYAAGTPTYEASSLLLTFLGGTVTIGGDEFAVSNVSLKGDNGLKTDRWFTTGKKEPVEEGMRAYTFELQGEFDSLDHYNRVAAASNAGATAVVELAWASPTTPLGLTVTLAAARFDTAPVAVDGAKVVTQTLSGKVTESAGASISAVYTTSDPTP